MSGSRGMLLSETRTAEIAVRELAYKRGAVLCEHRHDRAYISLVLDGQYTELRGDLPRRCSRGTVILHGPDEVHADAFVEDGRCVNFEFELGGTPLRAAVLRAVATTFPAYEMAIDAALRAQDGMEPQPASSGWVEGVLHDFRWLEPVPLDGASRLAGLHPTHFVRAFRKHVGMTPGAYRRRERVRAASSLLLGSAASLSRIAQDCGFSDQSHFTHVFREATGISPHRYRRAFAR